MDNDNVFLVCHESSTDHDYVMMWKRGIPAADKTLMFPLLLIWSSFRGNSRCIGNLRRFVAPVSSLECISIYPLKRASHVDFYENIF